MTKNLPKVNKPKLTFLNLKCQKLKMKLSEISRSKVILTIRLNVLVKFIKIKGYYWNGLISFFYS